MNLRFAKPSSRLLSSLAVLSGIAAQAAITSFGPFTTSLPAGPLVGGLFAGPWSLEIPFTVDLTAPGTTVPLSDASWGVTVTDGVLGPFHTVTIEAQHLVGPHGEGPSGIAALGVLFPATYPGGGSAYGAVQHHSPGPGGGDDWLLTLSVDPGATTASGTIYAWHTGTVIPEPATVATAAALGLLGFVGLRRRGRQTPAS